MSSHSKFAVLAVILLVASVPCFAQTATANAGFSVTATNTGVFTFAISPTTYAFGTVYPGATTNSGGTETLTSTTGTGTTTFTSTNGISWIASSAPVRTVRIYNSSTAGASSINFGTINSLQLRIPAVSGGTSCGFIGAGTTGDGGATSCTAGNLIHGITDVGRGANAVSGKIDLQLTINDTDAAASNTWVLQLTALGS